MRIKGAGKIAKKGKTTARKGVKKSNIAPKKKVHKISKVKKYKK